MPNLYVIRDAETLEKLGVVFYEPEWEAFGHKVLISSFCNGPYDTAEEALEELKDEIGDERKLSVRRADDDDEG